MREKKDIFARISARLDLPREALPGGFSVSLSGRELCVQGRAVILGYSEECVELFLGKRRICVRGNGLFCAELTPQRVLIVGDVCGIYLKREGEDAT